MFDRLRQDAQTLYAELPALLLARENQRQWSHLAGTRWPDARSGTAIVRPLLDR